MLSCRLMLFCFNTVHYTLCTLYRRSAKFTTRYLFSRKGSSTSQLRTTFILAGLCEYRSRSATYTHVPNVAKHLLHTASHTADREELVDFRPDIEAPSFVDLWYLLCIILDYLWTYLFNSFCAPWIVKEWTKFSLHWTTHLNNFIQQWLVCTTVHVQWLNTHGKPVKCAVSIHKWKY